MGEIKVGIMGYGWVAGAHIDAINSIPGALVSAICSSRPQDPAALSAKHGSEIAVYRDYEEMLAAPDVNVVSICSVHSKHPEQAIAAAKAGKHVIIEKPMALNLDDARRMNAEIQKAGVFACVCFECRYSGQFTTTRGMIDNGLLGRVHYAEVDYYHGIGPKYNQFKWNTRKDIAGSSLLTAGCHALDALLFCMGTDVEEVSAFSTRTSAEEFADYEYDTTTVALLRFTDGRIGKVASVIDCLQPYYFHVHLVGSKGSLLDNRFHSTVVPELNKSNWSKLSMKMLDSGDVSDHPYAAQFAAFFEAIKAGKPMPLTSIQEALRTHEILFAIDHAAKTGKPVALAEFLHSQ